MKVLKFKDKSRVTPADIHELFGECLETRDIVKTAVVHETSDGSLLVSYSDMNYAELLVLGATLQDFAMDGMKGKV